MRTIHHVVEVAAPPERVYDAIATGEGLSNWWTTKVEAGESVGSMIDFTFEGPFNPDMEVTALDPASLVAWQCVGGHEPWSGSTIRFELADGDGGTRVRFWQRYGGELDDDSYGIYNFNWAYYLNSLRLLCETGAGKPFEVSAS